jgi:hypothetical protein
MTLEEIDDSLPNGLHDMHVDRLSIDFAGRVASFEVEIWVGDLDSQSETEQEATRCADLTLAGLQYCVLDPPDPKYPFANPEPIWLVDLCEPDLVIPGDRPLPPGAFAARFFVNQWNSFIHVAALDARLTWK